MATKKMPWTQADYDAEAQEFVACYGREYDWHEFTEEYCATWDMATSKYARPDQGLLLAAILRAVK
jgi:hypothetical protein